MTTTTITLGDRQFDLDRNKAEAAYAAKRVINGRETMFFNILPLKYQWAYELYKTMKNNHWEPEDIHDAEGLRAMARPEGIADIERWIIKMGIGYFSAAEGIVGDNILHVVREVVTAPELKLVLGRHAHEENIHADSLVYMISSLGINPHECEAMFEDIPTIKEKNRFRRHQQPCPAPRHRSHAAPKTSRPSPRTSSSSASAWKAPSSTASSAWS